MIETQNKVNKLGPKIINWMVVFFKNQLSFLSDSIFDKNTTKLLDDISSKYKNISWIDDLIKWIKDTGDINYKYKGESLLHSITKYGYNDINNFINLLSVPWIDSNISDSLWLTPLMIAAKEWSNDIVKILLKHPNIDINKKQPSTWESAIFKTLWYRNLEIIKILYRDDRLDRNATNLELSTFKEKLLSRIKIRKINKNDPLLKEFEEILVSINWIMRHKL